MNDNIRGTKVNFNPINLAKITRYIFEDVYPIILSHHPDCKRYKSDIFTIGPLKLCIGCSLLYPAFLLSSISIILLFYLDYIEWPLLLILSPVFYSTLVLKYLGLTEFKLIKSMVAIYLGIGLACFFWGAVLTPYGFIFLLPLFILVNFLVVYSAKYRRMSVIKKCRRCAYKMKWVRCPGMKGFVKKLDADGFDISSQLKYKFE